MVWSLCVQGASSVCQSAPGPPIEPRPVPSGAPRAARRALAGAPGGSQPARRALADALGGPQTARRACRAGLDCRRLPGERRFDRPRPLRDALAAGPGGLGVVTIGPPAGRGGLGHLEHACFAGPVGPADPADRCRRFENRPGARLRPALRRRQPPRGLRRSMPAVRKVAAGTAAPRASPTAGPGEDPGERWLRFEFWPRAPRRRSQRRGRVPGRARPIDGGDSKSGPGHIGGARWTEGRCPSGPAPSMATPTMSPMGTSARPAPSRS